MYRRAGVGGRIVMLNIPVAPRLMGPHVTTVLTAGIPRPKKELTPALVTGVTAVTGRLAEAMFHFDWV